MEEIRYMISDAAKQIDVESHVLRYWEEELEMDIPRNEMGHRYYREVDIETMRAVKRLKDQGYQLKLIKMILPEIERIEQLEPGKLLNLKEQLELVTGLGGSESGGIGKGANARKEGGVGENALTVLKSNTTSDVLPEVAAAQEAGIGVRNEAQDTSTLTQEEKLLRFREIMGEIVSDAVADNNKSLTRAVSDSVSERVIKEMDYLMRVQEEREEERFRQIDRTLREYQQGKKQAAAAKEKKKARRLFRK